jgi:hypothetical protein
MIIECVFIASSLCRTVKDKPVMVVAAANAAMLTLDYRKTLEVNNDPAFHAHEANPLLRPLVHHPAAMYIDTAAQVVLFSWIGHRLRTSHSRIARMLWWLPQAASAAQGLEGYIYTSRHTRAHP